MNTEECAFKLSQKKKFNNSPGIFLTITSLVSLGTWKPIF